MFSMNYPEIDTGVSPDCKLKQNLAVFGLNPREWILEKRMERSYWIKNSQDQLIYFNGKSSAHNNRWKSLEVIL